LQGFYFHFHPQIQETNEQLMTHGNKDSQTPRQEFKMKRFWD